MIEFDKTAYSYGGGDLLSDMSLRLQPGSFYFLTGPSGAGKSTFLKLCYMELLSTRGTVQIFGQDSRDMGRDQIASARRRIGVVHQDCKFLDHLSLRENVSLPLTVAGRDVAESEEDIKSLMDWVGLKEQQGQRPPELSGGERQRAALARAIIMDPDIILADEPTGNVDWEMSKRLLSLLIELNKLGKSVIVATHDMNLIRTAKSQISARVLRIANNRLQTAGADL